MATAQPTGAGQPADGSTKQQLTAALTQARQHLIRNNPQAAIALLKEVASVADCPAEVRMEAAKMLGTAGAGAEGALCYLNAGLSLLYDHGDMTRARQAFASAHNLDPHNLDVIFHLGQADVVEGRTQDGLAKFIDVLRKSNLKHTPALFEAGCIYQASGQYDQAILAFKKVLDREKDHIQAIVHMGQLHQTKGMIPEAISYYLQAAQITRDAQQLGTTRQIANMILAIDTGNVRARGMLAELDEKSDEEEAEAQAQAQTKATPAGRKPALAPSAARTQPPSQQEPAKAAPAPPAQPPQMQASPPSASVAGELVAARAELEALAAERAKLEAVVAQARAQFAEAQRQQDVTVKARAEQEVQQEKALTEIAAKRAAAERELQDLQTRIGTAQAQAAQGAQQEKALNEVAAKRAAAERELQDLQTRIGTAQAQAAQGVQQEKALNEVAAKRAAAERELQELQARIGTAQAQAAQGVQQEKALSEIAAKRATAERELQQLEARMGTARAQSEQGARQEKALSEITAKRAAAERELQALEARIEQARSESAQAASTQEEIAKATAELDEKLLRLETAFNEAQARHAQAEREAASAAKAHDSKAAERNAQVAAQEERLRDLQQQVTGMQSNLAKAQTAHEAAMLEIAARRKRAQADLEKAQSEVAQVAREKDAQRERAELSVAELEGKTEQLRKELAATESRRKESETKALAAQRTLASIEGRVSEAKAKVETASADLKDIVEQTRQAQASAADHSAKLAELRAAVEAAEGRKRVLEDTMSKVKPLAASAEKRRTEAEAAAEQAEKARAKREAELAALEQRKREFEEALAKSKSLAAAAEHRRAQVEAAAEQAEALRAKREADSDALGTRIASLESALREADARVKASAAESAALNELSAKVSEQRNAVLELESKKVETEHALVQARSELESTRKALEEARTALEALPVSREPEVGPSVGAVEAMVSPETCGESLRTIETLAADGELPIEVATELAGLIHEGRAPMALREARKRANMEAAPAPFLLICGDLCRDLGDIAAAREAYRTVAIADPRKGQIAQSRTGDLFLAFAGRSTAAALLRDDAHFAAIGEPEKGIGAYAELVAKFPEDPSFREELGSLHEQLGNATAAALAYTQAMIGYLGGDDVVRAVELAPKLLATAPNEGTAFELAARAYERASRPSEAQGALDQALRVYREQHAASDMERVCRRLAETTEDPVPYRRELAVLFRSAGDTSGAAEQLIEAAEKLIAWSRGADAADLLKEAAAVAGDHEGIRERVEILLARAAEVQRSVDDAARGDLLVGKGQYDRAAQAYRRALEENPHDAGASYQLARLLMDHSKDYEAAEQLLQTASELRPNHAATRYRLALVKAARGQVVEAVELLIALARFDEANADFIEQFAERLEHEADAGDPAAKYRLGIAYRELGRVDEALVILQSIQRVTDFVVLCHNAIGLCLRRQGLDAAAAKRFTKAIETPGYPESQYHEALYNLGELYQAKNTQESLALALSSFEELYASDCTFRDVGDRIKSVKARMGAAERPKVKRLPTRTADQG